MEKKYKIIYADPPWRYWEGGDKNQSKHYGTMDLDGIKALPIKDLADEDCVLFIWVTFPLLDKSFEVIEAWGFSYSTVGFTWVKRNKDSAGFFFGCGGWTRANAELCLIATIGHPKRKRADVSQIISSKIREHSRKPDETRERIVQLMGDVPRIELFARQRFEGWDVWGNEAPTDIQTGIERFNPAQETYGTNRTSRFASLPEREK